MEVMLRSLMHIDVTRYAALGLIVVLLIGLVEAALWFLVAELGQWLRRRRARAAGWAEPQALEEWMREREAQVDRLRAEQREGP